MYFAFGVLIMTKQTDERGSRGDDQMGNRPHPGTPTNGVSPEKIVDAGTRRKPPESDIPPEPAPPPGD
jgi:hypothetical protein